MTRPTDIVALAASLSPADRVATSSNTSAIDMGVFHQALFLLQAGNTDTTVDFKLQDSSSISGAFSDIPGKAITSFTATDDNKQAIIEIDGSEAKRFVRAVIIGGSGTVCLVSIAAIGLRPRFGPARDANASTVAQIVY